MPMGNYLNYINCGGVKPTWAGWCHSLNRIPHPTSGEREWSSMLIFSPVFWLWIWWTSCFKLLLPLPCCHNELYLELWVKITLISLSDFFEKGSHCVSLADLELAKQTRLASDSENSACLCLLSAGMKGAHYHTHQQVAFKSISQVLHTFHPRTCGRPGLHSKTLSQKTQNKNCLQIRWRYLLVYCIACLHVYATELVDIRGQPGWTSWFFPSALCVLGSWTQVLVRLGLECLNSLSHLAGP